MARNYYGVPGMHQVVGKSAGKMYGKAVNQMSQVEAEPTPVQALIIFLVGLPFLPIWSGLAMLNALSKIYAYENSNPWEAHRWKSYLPWYTLFFIVGIIMYAILLPIVDSIIMY